MSRYAPLAIALSFLQGCSTTADAESQMTFATPEEAVTILVEACRAHDEETLTALFGTEYRDVIASGDPAADRQGRNDFVLRAEEHIDLEPAEDRTEILIGTDAWPLPVPLVREDGRWRFDTAQGVEEITNRRVGRNELEAIALCRGFVDAQYIYRNRDWNGDGHWEYAQKIKSTPGKFDGLYWPTDDPTVVPLCPLHEMFTANQDYVEHREKGTPWRGYYVKVLRQQGEHAEGGAKSYMSDGRMIGGFALIAWPADHDRLGVMTLVVSHHGIIYEKNLGEDTTDLVAEIEAFDPDETWRVVDG